MTTSDPANPVEQYSVYLVVPSPAAFRSRDDPTEVREGSSDQGLTERRRLLRRIARDNRGAFQLEWRLVRGRGFGPTVVTCVPTSIQPASITGWAARVARITTVASRVASSADPVDRAGSSSSSTALLANASRWARCGLYTATSSTCRTLLNAHSSSTPDAQIDHPRATRPHGGKGPRAAPPSAPVRLNPSSHTTTIPSIRPPSSQTTTS